MHFSVGRTIHNMALVYENNNTITKKLEIIFIYVFIFQKGVCGLARPCDSASARKELSGRRDVQVPSSQTMSQSVEKCKLYFTFGSL